jgi:hypothetical protein
MEVLERWVQSNDNVLWLFERELGMKRRVSDRKIGVALSIYKRPCGRFNNSIVDAQFSAGDVARLFDSWVGCSEKQQKLEVC